MSKLCDLTSVCQAAYEKLYFLVMLEVGKAFDSWNELYLDCVKVFAFISLLGDGEIGKK